MESSNFSTIIEIEQKEKQLKFFSMVGNDKNSAVLTQFPYYKERYDDVFFKTFNEAISAYAKKNPASASKASNVTIILPDNNVATDCINIPVANKKSMDTAIEVAIKNKYSNLNNLKVNKFITSKNKQFITYSLSIVRQELLRSLHSCCSTNALYANVITSAGNSTVNGAIALSNKLKSSSFIFLDIKLSYSRICFVCKGVTCGSFMLPFGYSIFDNKKIVAENMLFDHSPAELVVINAREKARAKKLTMMGVSEAEENNEGGGEQSADDSQQDSLNGANEEESSFSENSDADFERKLNINQIKTLPKKVPKIYPKFMQRPAPETEADAVYENFRYFVKWTLEFIRGNSELNGGASFNNVYVNMPKQYEDVFARVNEEKKENGIEFTPFAIYKEKDIIAQNLDLYGGLFVKQFNLKNNF